MDKERNKADSYREAAYSGDAKAMNNLGVCYERGVGCWDLQIHPVWAKASEANDLRWIQIHGDLHRVLRNTEKNT